MFTKENAPLRERQEGAREREEQGQADDTKGGRDLPPCVDYEQALCFLDWLGASGLGHHGRQRRITEMFPCYDSEGTETAPAAVLGAEHFEFRCLPDNSARQRYKPNSSGTLGECWANLEARNQAGDGVYIQINQSRTRGKQRGEDIGKVRALFADFDPPKGQPRGTPEGAARMAKWCNALRQDRLPPSLIVQSSADGLHAYWLLADDLPLEQFAPLQRAIAAEWGSDASVCDLPRILRLPGFLHQKGDGASGAVRPFMSRILHQAGADGGYYSAAQLRQRYPQYANASKSAVRTNADFAASSANFALYPAQDKEDEISVLDVACHTVASTAEGQRNPVLNREAFHIAQQIAGGLLAVSEDEARQRLHSAALASGLEEGETKATIASAFAKGMQDPLRRFQSRSGSGFEVSQKYGAKVLLPARKEGAPPLCLPLCDALHVLADTRDDAGERGRLLRWQGTDGAHYQWVIPFRLLHARAQDVVQELAARWLGISDSVKAQSYLPAYIQAFPAERETRCTEKLGWHGDCFLLPDKTLSPEGHNAAPLVFQNRSSEAPPFASAGTLEQWREQVAAKATGNSRLLLALCAAFAAPLVKLAGIERGGYAFHLRGSSSTGKTTALQVAASVWGKPSAFCVQWRSTANALEGLAESRNDSLLPLDELSQADPKELKHLPYMYASGQGKARQKRDGGNRPLTTWRGLQLSTGEKSLADQLHSIGERPNAGQELRFFDIEGDAGQGMGLFECLNGEASAAALAQHLDSACAQYHGAVGEAYLQHLLDSRAALLAELPERLRAFVQSAVPQDAGSQVQRAAKAFALLATAGERATACGLTGWRKGEASQGIKRCFAAWLQGYGSGNREERAALEQVQGFIAAHLRSRFIPWNSPLGYGATVHNAAGYWRETQDGDTQFLVHPHAYKNDLLQGADPKTATAALRAAGWLLPDKDGKNQQRAAVQGTARQRYYVFSARAMGLHVPSAWGDSADPATPAPARTDAVHNPITH